MKKLGLILGTAMMMLVLLMPMGIEPARALTISAPSPIPGNLIPTGGLGVSIPITLPNLGTVSILPLSVYSITETHSGIVASDSLTNETESQQQLQANKGYWTYGGDAPGEGAPYAVWRDTQGLHVGAQAPSNGTWAGYYAVTPNTPAMVFHSIVTTPEQTIPSNYNWYENGMYVQNGPYNVSYITCTSNTSIVGTQWVVSSAIGNAYGATSEKVLWASPMSLTEPRTADCTIITNGTNFLEVILNNAIVFQSNTMNLGYTNPLVAFLEPQSNYAGQMLNGTFTDFFAASDVNVKVTNNPALASTVDLVVPTSSSTGQVVASAPVDSSGTATLNIGNYPMPLDAYIKVYSSTGVELASTSQPVNIFGGDSYSVQLLGGILGGSGGILGTGLG
ncbi:MAG: hypothetical protein KGI33_00430 [Thaumarchaeota archaeon]|nr:hypothetical protein [Nitrososphaerota archaeon]